MAAGMIRRPIANCRAPWTWLYVDLAGNARPCCFASTSHYFGNVKDLTIEEIWNGPDMVKLRAAIRDGYVHPACRHAGCAHVRDTERLFGAESYDVRAPLDTEISLHTDNSNYCYSGWIYPDPSCICSNSSEASLHIKPIDAPIDTDLQLNILCRGVVHELFPLQRVRILLNNQTTSYLTFVYPAMTNLFIWQTIHIPAALLDNNLLDVRFVIEEPVPSEYFGTNGLGRLGIVLSAFRISAFPAAKQLQQAKPVPDEQHKI
jgi:hypothetical protein